MTELSTQSCQQIEFTIPFSPILAYPASLLPIYWGNLTIDEISLKFGL